MNGIVLEEGTLRGERAIYTCLSAGPALPSHPSWIPLPIPAPRGPRSQATRADSWLGDGAGTVPLLPLDYQKVKQGMLPAAARVPECVAGLWPALLPPHPIPTPGLPGRPSLQNDSPVIGRTLSVEFKARLHMPTIKK